MENIPPHIGQLKREYQSPHLNATEEEANMEHFSVTHKSEIEAGFPSIPIYYVGSSHLSGNHGLVSQINEKYKELENPIKYKYYNSLVLARRGGGLEVKQEIVEFAQRQASRPGYQGMVVTLLIGSNSAANPDYKISTFRTEFADLLDRLLEIPQIGLLVCNLPPRSKNNVDKRWINNEVDMYRYNEIITTNINQLARSGKKICRVAIDRELGEYTKDDTFIPKDGILQVDGTHLTEKANKIVAKLILNMVANLPAYWFPNYYYF